jgi:hypothetical protein
MSRVAEERQSLMILTASPVVWAAHFMLSYITAAVWCGRQANALVPLVSVRSAIGLYTAAALAAIAYIGWSGYRAHRLQGEPAPHDDDTPEDRHRFIGFATLLLSGLSALAVVYAALAALFIRSCE